VVHEEPAEAVHELFSLLERHMLPAFFFPVPAFQEADIDAVLFKVFHHAGVVFSCCRVQE
jgi:hypothetical protein